MAFVIKFAAIPGATSTKTTGDAHEEIKAVRSGRGQASDDRRRYAGVRENTAQLFKVMSNESTLEQERRTSRGLEQIQLTAITMIRLIEKLGKTDG